jgi:cystathionine beta-lyase/cystathionine gamma-synthase
MKTPLHLIAIAACCLAATGAAPNPTAPVSDALRSIAQRGSKNLIAAAEEMPPDKYGFKPTPAQMSFGKVIAHLSGGNDFLCSAISGAEAPKRPELSETAPKEKLVARLRETFQFCESVLAKVNDSDLGGQVPFFGQGKVSRAEAMFAAAEDWADHYSQLAIYLRLNGLLPPTAKRAQS